MSTSDPFEVALFLQEGANIVDYPYDTQAAVLSNSKVILVVFRGSEAPPAGIRDWLTNLNQGARWINTPTDWGQGQVHRGFTIDTKRRKRS